MKVLVRSTVNLQGFPRGSERVADTDIERVARYLKAGWVVLVNPADAVYLRKEKHDGDKEVDSVGVPVHGAVLEEPAEVEGADDGVLETGDEQDGFAPVEEVR